LDVIKVWSHCDQNYMLAITSSCHLLLQRKCYQKPITAMSTVYIASPASRKLNSKTFEQ